MNKKLLAQFVDHVAYHDKDKHEHDPHRPAPVIHLRPLPPGQLFLHRVRDAYGVPAGNIERVDPVLEPVDVLVAVLRHGVAFLVDIYAVLYQYAIHRYAVDIDGVRPDGLHGEILNRPAPDTYRRHQRDDEHCLPRSHNNSHPAITSDISASTPFST